MIITRNVDLSVGSIVGLTAYLTGRMFIDIPGIPLIGVFIGGVLLGGFLGLINGALVAFARVPALVITLGTLYIYRGINVAWAGGDRINASDLPKDFRGARHRPHPRHPDPHDHRRRRADRRRLVPAQPALAAASCTRSAPTPPPRTSTACASPAA